MGSARIAVERAPLPVYAGPAPNSTDPVELVTQIKTAFEQFKAANDERLKQIEKTGSALPETLAKVEAINGHITDLQKALDEQSKALARLTVGGSGEANDNPQKHARAFYREALLARGESAIEVRRQIAAGVDVDAYAAYRDAFDQLIVCNGNPDMLRPDVRAALSVGADPSGGYVVPPERSGAFLTRIHEASPIRQYVTVRSIGGDAWEQPLDLGEGISGGWVAEKPPRPKTGTPGLNVQRIEVHEQYAYPEITQKMLEDATLIDPASWLEAKSADKMLRDESAAFVTGDGVGKPRGFLSYTVVTTDDKSRAWGELQYIPSGAAGAFATAEGEGSVADPIIDIVYSLKQAFRAGSVWMMNRKSVATVRKLKDAHGNYRWQPSLQPGQPSTLEGYAIAEAEDMPDIAANSLSIGFGNFREAYTVVDRLGLTVMRDPYTNKPFVGFYIRKRVGGDVVNFDAIKFIKFAAS